MTLAALYPAAKTALSKTPLGLSLICIHLPRLKQKNPPSSTKAKKAFPFFAGCGYIILDIAW